jgi:cytochrome c553
MNNGSRFAFLRDRWFLGSVGGTFVLLVFAVVVGFVWLPTAQNDALFKGLLNSICSAAGVPRGWLVETGAPVPPSKTASTVVLTSGMTTNSARDGSIGRGGTLALKCTMCHGIRGVSASDTPNLAGQTASSIYKQMRDFQSGARASAVMAPLVTDLSDQDLRDLAAFYASLPRSGSDDPGSAPDIVATGAPMRNIAPCESCHGGVSAKLGAPWLASQPRAYLKTQLEAFAHGTRRNDINAQMRNVARNMTPEEIEASVDHYANGSRGEPHANQ